MSLDEIFKKLAESRAQKEPAGPPELIVVGLGNPGREYENTRHNAGFMAMDLFCARNSLRCEKLRFKALCGEAVIGGRRALLMKPQTYMNNSGEAVREAADFYKIAPENIIVMFDDISLEPGRLRIRAKGSDGGHNGIKSILYHLQSDKFPRIKIGVGAKPHPDYDLADWVLGRFEKEDQEKVFTALENAGAALPLMAQGRLDEAQGRFNC